MAEGKQKLELTWIGKERRPKLEPRILIEDPDKSYGERHSENVLIFGDNLLALKSLEQSYVGRIKRIFIDPPYNACDAFTHYDDGLQKRKALFAINMGGTECNYWPSMACAATRQKNRALS